MKHLFLIGLILTGCFNLLSCKRVKHNVAVITNDTIQLYPIVSEKAIQFDSLKLKDKSDKLKLFYRYNEFKTVWNLAENRKDLIDAIEKIDEDGLNPELYNLSNLKKAEENYLKTDDNNRVLYDILFSESFYKLSYALYNGAIDPLKFYNDWDIEPKKINTGATMHIALENNAIRQSLDSLSPNNSIYKGLKEALASLKKLPETELYVFKSNKKFKENETSEEIKELQKTLRYWGDLETDSLSGRYDKTTIAALKKFQARNGLEETGTIGAQTLVALNKTKSDYMDQIRVNLERWRWYPRDLGKDYVLVNIPDYSLVAVSDNDTIQSHKVIVGKIERKTPILSSAFSGLVINPTWTVPPTILKNDLTPAATRNRGYFASRGFTIYDNKGQVVSPEAWDPSRASSYRYVQKPGKSNSLGRIKFDFKNNHMVYLHDTNNKNNFNKDDRDLSSGCIRVQDPFDLADFILKTEKSTYTKAKIEGILETEKTQHIPLKRTIKIHQFYWTAWNSKTGIQFRDDTYHLDIDLAKKLNEIK